MERFKKDLSLAGIPEVDERGYRADFHALRHTYCTNLARKGINPWLAMKLMRHSDISLTVKVYTDAGIFLDRATLDKIPDMSAIGEENGSKPCSHGRSHDLGFSDQNVAQAVTEGVDPVVDETPINIDRSRLFIINGGIYQT